MEAHLRVDNDRMTEAVEAFDITENLPNPSDQRIFPEIIGLTVTPGFCCIKLSYLHCPYSGHAYFIHHRDDSGAVLHQ
jgi:hypothetical protein